MRTQGTFNFGANLEVKKDAPLDARTLVPSYADLTLDATWKDSDGNAWTYPGMLVTCLDRPGKLYQLTAADYTKSANWREIGAEVDLSNYATKDTVPNALNVSTDADEVRIALARTEKGETEDISSDYFIPAATSTGAGVMTAEDRKKADLIELNESEDRNTITLNNINSFSASNGSGVMVSYDADGFNLSTEGSDNFVVIQPSGELKNDVRVTLPTQDGRLALYNDITTETLAIKSDLREEISTKADSSALTALETKVDAKADAADLPTAIEDTEINDICK